LPIPALRIKGLGGSDDKHEYYVDTYLSGSMAWRVAGPICPRHRWEFSHVARAGLAMLSLMSITVAATFFEEGPK
jgi:hypothetical protein